jgi:long-chain acyl-CoA synthetase
MTSMPTQGGPPAVPPSDAASHPWLSCYPDGVDWHAGFEPAPHWHLLDRAVASHPSRNCTNFYGKTLTYAEIGALVDRATGGLQRLGVGKGTRVGLLLPNSPTFIVFYFAILKAGGTVVNYNPLYTLEELEFQIADSRTELMVTLDLKITFGKVDQLLQQGKLPRAIVASFAALLPGAKSVLFRLMKSADLARPAQSPAADKIVAAADLLTGNARVTPVAINPVEDVAVLQYTGGTTGTPKGAMLTHANVYVNTLQVLAWAPGLDQSQQRMLGVLPFFHVFAMTVVMNFSIALAAEIVIVPRFVLDDVLKLIDRTRPTCMPGVPTMFTAIVNHPKLSAFDLSSLQFCLSGGAPLPLEIKQRFETLTGCSLVEGYGLSETSPVVTCNPLSGPVREGSIGLPLPATIVSLRSIEDPSVEVALGEQGEICVKGPQVMKGYWERPRETADQFVGAYLRTGDVARMDEQGFLFIEDRIKDLIISSGYNVYPRRIEEALYQHPAVAEVTVIGVPDEYRGEVPKAFVRLKPGESATATDLMAHLEAKISRIELPEEIEFRDELPKTMIGKLSKKELKAEELARRGKPG